MYKDCKRLCKICLYAKAMEAALAAGAKRRALAAQYVMATPGAPGQTQKRPLTKTSPGATISTTASPATVTPEAKRLMLETNSNNKAVEGTGVVPGHVDPSAPTIPALELFPDDPMVSPPGRSWMGTGGHVMYNETIYIYINIYIYMCGKHFINM